MVAVLKATTVDSPSVRWAPNAELASEFRAYIALYGDIAPNWQIVQPLIITIEQGEESFIASDDLFAMYGVGDDTLHAVRDYISALIEYYDVLSAHDDPDTTQLFRYLQTYLRPTSTP
jgi:hypothetical protein